MADSKKLVVYFSAAGGITKTLAERLAEGTGADLFEIAPAQPYTEADLDWRDASSRTTLEMKDPACRPAMAAAPQGIEDYDEVFIGFPIWWYVAPRIVETFLESADFAGKKIALFATSGGSDMGKTLEELKPLAPGARWAGEKRFDASATPEDLATWATSLGM